MAELVPVTGNELAHANKVDEIMLSINSGMTSTDLRAARADINNELKAVESNRTQFKRDMIAMYEEKFAAVYGTDQIKESLAIVDKWMKDAAKAELEAELAQIEEWIIEENDNQVERNLLPKALRYKGKSKSYVISDIGDRIDAIIYEVDEVEEVAPTPPPTQADFNVTLTVQTDNKALAREIQTLCRKAGVKVVAKKG